MPPRNINIVICPSCDFHLGERIVFRLSEMQCPRCGGLMSVDPSGHVEIKPLRAMAGIHISHWVADDVSGEQTAFKGEPGRVVRRSDGRWDAFPAGENAASIGVYDSCSAAQASLHEIHLQERWDKAQPDDGTPLKNGVQQPSIFSDLTNYFSC